MNNLQHQLFLCQATSFSFLFKLPCHSYWFLAYDVIKNMGSRPANFDAQRCYGVLVLH